MEIQDLKIEFEQVGSLLEYKNNAKMHTPEQVAQITASIREFGFNDPLAVWTNADGASEIIEGHGRLMAARELGIEEVPVIHLDRLTDDQRRAYALVHNQLTMNTGWDFSALDAELESLAEFDMGAFGFDNAKSFDAIEDLINEDFVSLKDRCDSEFFNITFSFPVEDKKAVDSLIRQAGKDEVVKLIVEEARKWE